MSLDKTFLITQCNMEDVTFSTVYQEKVDIALFFSNNFVKYMVSNMLYIYFIHRIHNYKMLYKINILLHIIPT